MKVELTQEAIDSMRVVISYLWEDELECCLSGIMEGKDCPGCAFEGVKGIAKFLTDTGAADYSKDLADAAAQERDAKDDMAA